MQKVCYGSMSNQMNHHLASFRGLGHISIVLAPPEFRSAEQSPTTLLTHNQM